MAVTVATGSPGETEQDPAYRSTRPPPVPYSTGFAGEYCPRFERVTLVGETSGLTVNRVDFLRRQIVVDRQVVDPDETFRPVFGPPKTAVSVRVVPMSQFVVDTVARHLMAWPAELDALVFTAPRGGVD